MENLKKILTQGSDEEKLALFNFKIEDSNEKIRIKFNFWARYFFPKYFTSDDADFHKKIDLYNIRAYKSEIRSFTDIVFRDGAKTTRTKLFFAFVIANDTNRFRKYLKILSKDLGNAKQSVTDIYNMLVTKRILALYPEIFAKTVALREETMSSFTTSTGIKLKAGTVGTDQRGDLQDENRPDLIWFDDFETRDSLRSAVKTQAIWDNMDEARTGLSKDGACIYTCNYISERGNVHKLVISENVRNIVLIVPILKDGKPTWSARHTLEYIEQLKEDTTDFAGEYLCEPSAGGDVLFDRKKVNEQKVKDPIEELAGFKIFAKYDASGRYAGGHDVAGGVGLDSSTSVFINFDVTPCQVVGTYKNNTIKPDTFGDEIKRHGDIFGTCLLAPEKNNQGIGTIGRLKQIYDKSKIFKTKPKETKLKLIPPIEFGWDTNGATKPKMMYALSKAVEKGHLDLMDKDLIAEAKSYSRDDLMDSDEDVRLTTRHFDLLIACAIAWQMKDYAKPQQSNQFKTNNKSSMR